MGICLSLGHEGTDCFDTIDEEHAFLVVFPDEDADLVGVAAGGVVVGVVGEVLEQEAEGGGHAVAFELPQMDLVEDGGGQDRQGGAGAGLIASLLRRMFCLRVPSHLWVRVRRQV